MFDSRPDSAGNAFRVKRFKLFEKTLEHVLATKRTCTILDIGGEPTYWTVYGRHLDWKRVRLCMLNVVAVEVSHPSIEALVGDARSVQQFDDGAFDIVYSNSVLEHVGRWSDMVAMAREVRRLGAHYFVQTPYFWFPIEPHFRVPFFHWLPESLRYRILMQRKSRFWDRQTDVGMATNAVQSASLLDRRQMQFLFPDATIVSERVLGITKSLMAIR